MDDSSPRALRPGARITVFRSRLNNDATSTYAPLALEAEARARAAPGFVDFKTFVAADGERLSLVIFDTPEHHEAWRTDSFHLELQELGRRLFYDDYEILVCELLAARTKGR